MLFFSLENKAQISAIGKAAAKTGVKSGVKAVAKKSIKDFYTNAVILKTEELKGKEQQQLHITFEQFENILDK